MTGAENSNKHWKEFCPNGGFALGFSSLEMQKAISSYRNNIVKKKPSVMKKGISELYSCEEKAFIYYTECIYNKSESIKKCLSWLDCHFGETPDCDYGFVACQLMAMREQSIYAFKREKFKDEKEIRIAYREPVPPDTNSISTFHISDSMLKKVFISTDKNIDDNKKKLEELKRKSNRTF
mgnify:CR=1 FL=1